MKSSVFLIIFSFLLLSCKNQKTEEDPSANNVDTMSAKYTLTPFSPSHEFEDATLDAINYKDGKFSARIGGTTYQLGEQTPDTPQKQCANSAEGQHLHLIVDTQPYVAVYTETFDHQIPDGDHYVLSFLSRSYHESLKGKSQYQAVKATVRNNSFEKSEPIQDMMLFYSRPKGLYTGEDRKKVMLDFYLVNVDLGQYKVEADINGEKHMIDKWEPYYIEGLPEGDNTITLTLLDSSGQKANIPLNPVSRTFQLEKTPEASQ